MWAKSLPKLTTRVRFPSPAPTPCLHKEVPGPPPRARRRTLCYRRNMMPKSIRGGLTALVAIFAAVPSAALPAASDMHSLQFLLGNWQVSAVDPSTGDKELLCYAVSRFLGDRWLTGHGTGN